ncbi:MAG: GNAT family N-acetyltransferase [Acidobacteriota bacterium]|nr:GNAT family N-acetyltransferase [Acidobacteriota bacterium]
MVPTPLEIQPPRYIVRPLESADFWHLRRLESEIWGADATGQLCPYYLRLCTELYPEWCFIALVDERPVGYVLNFPNGKVAYCATLAVHPDYQKGKVNYLLIRAMLAKLFQEDMLECRFLVEPDNRDARSVHNALGARVVREVDDYYQQGDRRLWSAITKADLDRARARYTRLRLVS